MTCGALASHGRVFAGDAEDYGTQLPDEGRRYLKAIREGAQRMGTLNR